MFLGQLYFYEKELSRLGSNIVVDDFLGIEIAGTQLAIKDLQGIGNIDEFGLKLKEIFIANYDILLTENKLYKALSFWKYLTSAIQENIDLKPSSDFQKALLEWILAGSELKDLENEALSYGKFSNDQEDFALYYGLHVLHLIYLSQKNSAYSESALDLSLLENDVLETELGTEPEMLIISSNNIKPLINNLNCIFVASASTKEIIVEKTKAALNDFNSIKLIIVDTQDQELLHSLKKSNTNNVLLVELNFSGTQENNFFDILVKQTLGINLN